MEIAERTGIPDFAITRYSLSYQVSSAISTFLLKTLTTKILLLFLLT